MLKIFAAALLATSIFAGPAHAHGGGAETMPGTNFTDLPSYHPKPLAWRKIPHKPARWHQGTVRDN
jgi:hypothetical protein